jgi:tetratricopeptide (TPR) repeat protein
MRTFFVFLTLILSSAFAASSPDCEKLPAAKKNEAWEKANCFFKGKNFVRATEVFQRLAVEYPEELEAYFLASHSLWEQGKLAADKEREKLYAASLAELEKAAALQPEHWRIPMEIGDHFFLREQKPEKAHRFYLQTRKYYEGSEKKRIPAATDGQKSAIENRIARTNEMLDRRGDAVTATCLSLYFDPDNAEAKGRLERLGGACKRKNFRPKS